ncbi:MAG: KamA family radical SAM protein [Candidatus Krumholzibacteriia bacterium]
MSRSGHPEPTNRPTLAEVLPSAAADPHLAALADVPVPDPLKPPVSDDDLDHRRFDEAPFWRTVPAFAGVDEATFLDPAFQNKHSVTSPAALRALLGDLAAPAFLDDVAAGFAQAPMNVRLTPYILSRIDWSRPTRPRAPPVARGVHAPARPSAAGVRSAARADDSLADGLVHRYPDKVLFLALDVCPYCRFCTRSYAIGGSTDTVEKDGYKPRPGRWQQGLAYIASRPEVEDVVLSGGDAFMLPARRLRELLLTLLAIPHVRRIRVASKGPAVMPMKILRDEAWTDALCGAVARGRELGKEVCLHTHVNTSEEISYITRDAMDLLFQRGVKVRNQSVLIRGVNDDPERMVRLVRRLSAIHVQPYYVYQHDMVKGVEELRTRLADSLELERWVRGATAGFNTPTFVTDAPGGGGKRDLHSFDYYDEVTGISIYRSPHVDPDLYYVYYDPLDRLPAAGRRRWRDPNEHARMVKEAVLAAGLGGHEPARPI